MKKKLLFDGCKSDIWFDDNFIDITTETSRGDFIDENGVELEEPTKPHGKSPKIAKKK